MPDHNSHTDRNFGEATWDDRINAWRFALVFPSGRIAQGDIWADDNNLHLALPELEESRTCVRWVQANELRLRQYVAEKMYQLMLDWHDPEWGSPLTKAEFVEKLTLSVVSIGDDHRASLQFSDADCFGGHWITFSVGADGELTEEPFLWG